MAKGGRTAEIYVLFASSSKVYRANSSLDAIRMEPSKAEAADGVVRIRVEACRHRGWDDRSASALKWRNTPRPPCRASGYLPATEGPMPAPQAIGRWATLPANHLAKPACGQAS